MLTLFDLFVSAVVCELLDAKKQDKKEKELDIPEEIDYVEKNVREQAKQFDNFHRVAGLCNLVKVTPYFMSYEALFNYCEKEYAYINGLTYITKEGKQNVQ